MSLVGNVPATMPNRPCESVDSAGGWSIAVGTCGTGRIGSAGTVSRGAGWGSGTTATLRLDDVEVRFGFTGEAVSGTGSTLVCSASGGVTAAGVVGWTFVSADWNANRLP